MIKNWKSHELLKIPAEGFDLFFDFTSFHAILQSCQWREVLWGTLRHTNLDCWMSNLPSPMINQPEVSGNQKEGWLGWGTRWGRRSAGTVERRDHLGHTPCPGEEGKVKNVINDKKNTSSLKTHFPLNYKDIRVCKREVTVEGIVFPARIVSYLFFESK